MNTLALDCATKTGWALLDGKGRIIESGVQDFSKARGETNGLVFLRFRNWLAKLINFRPMHGGLLLVYERAHMRGGAATELCVGMQTRVQEAAAERGIESLPVTSTTLKKWATGNGRSGKYDMIAAAKQHLGRNPIDDNEADAVLLAKYAYAEYVSK